MVKAQSSTANPDGGGRCPNGSYHLIVEKVTDSPAPDDGSAVVVESRILAGKTADGSPVPTGHLHKEYVPYEGKRAFIFFNWAIALGLLTHDEWKRLHANGQDIDINEQDFVGRQMCAQVAENKNPNTGKTYANIGPNCFTVNDEKAQAIPKDQQYLQMLGQVAQPAAGTAQPAAQPVNQAAAQPAGEDLF